MRRASLAELIRLSPGLKPLLHECWGCHKIGVKPGILDTKHGDYGWRQSVKEYADLPLDSRGLCTDCVANPPADISH